MTAVAAWVDVALVAAVAAVAEAAVAVRAAATEARLRRSPRCY